MPVLALILLPLVLAIPSAAHVFRAGADLIAVPVTVTGEKDRFAEGLEAADFRLLDSGRPQVIHVDPADIAGAPVSLVVLVQANDLAGPALAKINKVGSMIRPLITGERGQAAVIRFGPKVDLLREFTADENEIMAVFAKIGAYSGSEARLRDAVSLAERMLRSRRQPHRKAILLVSETRDRGSATSLEETVNALQHSAITVFAATYSV